MSHVNSDSSVPRHRPRAGQAGWVPPQTTDTDEPDLGSDPLSFWLGLVLVCLVFAGIVKFGIRESKSAAPPDPKEARWSGLDTVLHGETVEH